MPNYWLMKTEPESFSFDDLAARGEKGEGWDGVRNYQARNFMREMRCGDRVLFYHSCISPPGIVGIAEVIREAYPDPTQFDPQSGYYYDPKATPEKPRWWQVDIRYVAYFKQFVGLPTLREHSELANMHLLQKGSRLSVMPVQADEWDYILELGGIHD